MILSKKIPLVTLAWATLLTPALTAQSDSESETTKQSAASQHTASFIPVGPRSKPKSVGQGADMRFVATDPDALPPRRLSLDREGAESSLFTNLNRPTVPVSVPPGPLSLYDTSTIAEGASAPRFLTIDIPESPGHYDVFFTRDTKRADWTDCDTLVLPGSETDFPPNTVRLINLSDHPTIALINEERVALRPGGVQFAPFTGEQVTIKGAFRAEERWRVLLNTRIASGDNSRINIVFYPRRSERTPAAASVYFQPEIQLGAGEAGG